MKTIAVIPARGGSKRIPNKNIVDFCGKPMIAWTIEAALDSKKFDRVVVSTEIEDIAAISRAYGAEVPFLRTKFYDDETPISKATIHAVEEMKEHFQEEYDVVVQLMANCPLRRSSHIIESLGNFLDQGTQFQLSCCRYGWQNPWWAFGLDVEFNPSPLFPKALKQRSQDLSALYCPTGAVWIAKSGALLEQGTFYGDGFRLFPMDWKASVDIDDLEDLDFARVLYSSLNR